MLNKRLRKSLKKTLNKKENKLITFAGELGIPLNGSKLVEVPNRKGYVFVRISGNMSEVIQAYNSEVSAIYGLPVLIARQNNVYRVIGRNLDLYRDWNNIPYLPRHGTQHSFNHALGMGSDITWVYSQQFMPLLAYPSGSAGSMHLSVVPSFYSWQGDYQYAQTTGTPNFAPYLPTITGSAVMTLLYIRPSDNSLQILAGSPFSNSITGSAEIAQYIPDIDRSVGIPLAAVRLVTGTTGITWNNIYDVRDFFTIGQGGGGSGLGFVAQNEGILLGTGTVLNFVGAGVDASISGSVVRVFITGSPSNLIPSTGTFVFQDEGVTLGSAPILNVAGSNIAASISGSTAQIFSQFPPEYISGLDINYSASGTIVVQSGSAFIPSLNRLTFVTGSISRNIPIVATTVSGSWQNIYLFESGGVPTIQVTGTAPSNPYAGIARTKTGDPSMRYIGSVYCDVGGFLYRFNTNVVGNAWRTNWLEVVNAYPFQFANVSGTVNTPTLINIPWLTPPTSGLIFEMLIQTVHSLAVAGDNILSITDNVSIAIPATSNVNAESVTRMTNGALAATNIQIAASPLKITFNQLLYTHTNVAGTNAGFFRSRGYSIHR